LKPGMSWDYAETRDETLRLMKEAGPHLVYFYCHGGLDGKQPYIKVGPSKGPRITESLLRAERIRWHEPRPLVFINGCDTTALEPEQAIEFVSSFIALANASGVIGTEITVFEPLAKPFAENFLRSFVVGGKSCGESMRSARLALLKAGNPLGLVYLPFVIGTLRLVERAA
jgi:CHAT domain